MPNLPLPDLGISPLSESIQKARANTPANVMGSAGLSFASQAAQLAQQAKQFQQSFGLDEQRLAQELGISQQKLALELAQLNASTQQAQRNYGLSALNSLAGLGGVNTGRGSLTNPNTLNQFNSLLSQLGSYGGTGQSSNYVAPTDPQFRF